MRTDVFSVGTMNANSEKSGFYEKNEKLFGGGKLRLFCLLAFLQLGWSFNVQAGTADPPQVSTESEPKYYVIQNANTLGYLRYQGKDGLGVVNRSKLLASVDDNSLYYFEANSGGYSIASKGAANDSKAGGKYLTSRLYSGDLAYYDATAAVFYIGKNPYDQVGCVVSTSSGLTSDCWYQHSVSGNNYVELEDLSNDESFKWIFKSYDDLLEEAEGNGVVTTSYEAMDRTEGASFQALIEAINTAKNTAKDSGTVKSMDSGKKYLLKNRRYGYYLNSNGTAFYGTTTATDYSTWNFTSLGGVAALVNGATDVAVRLNTGASNNQYFSLDPAVSQSFNATVIASSDGDQRFIAFQGVTISSTTYFLAMVSDKTVLGRNGQSFSSDWEFVEAVEGENYDHVILSADELLQENYEANGAWFFRIRNVGRDVQNYASDQFDGGGWMEDVDHIHAQYRLSETSSSAFSWVQEEAQLMYDAYQAEVYAAMPDMTHASALWEFVLVGRGATVGENATGLISPEHNIYRIRNANTGKYLVASDSDVTLSETEDGGTPFYLQQLVDGQFALTVYGGTDYASGADSNSGFIGVTQTSENKHGGLTYTSSGSATVNTNSAWLIMPAPTLHLNILTTGTVDAETGDAEGYEWSTLYYPFDVEPGTKAFAREITFFQGGWVREPDYSNSQSPTVGTVEMKEMVDVPGGNPVFVRTNMNGEESYGALVLNVYPANSGKLQSSASDFEGNVWEGIVESEGHYFGDDWRNYWILSKNKNNVLKLLHPAGNYLLPNRAYISNNAAQSLSVGARLSSINMVFTAKEESYPTAVDVLRQNSMADGAIFNMAGQRMDATTLESLPKGLYIQNGRKILIK